MSQPCARPVLARPRLILARTHLKQSSSNTSVFPCQDLQKNKILRLKHPHRVAEPRGSSQQVPSNLCPCHQQQLRDRRCISTREPRPCPEGSQKCPRIRALKTPRGGNLLNRKTRSAVGGSTTGFGGRFCGGFFGLAGGCMGVVFWRIFCVQVADFLADFFVA